MNCKTVWLRKRDTGPIITELEVFLKTKGKYPYKLDKIFGSGVETGVKSLQHDLKIKEDGIFGPETCSKSGISKPNPTPAPPKGKWWNLFQQYMGIVVNSATEVYVNLKLHGAHYSFYEDDKQSNLQVLIDLKNGGGSNCTDIAQLLKIYEEMGYTVRFIREEVKCSNGE